MLDSPGARAQSKSKPRFGVFSVILLALFLGVGCGLFFGEYCDPLSIVGDAYVGLLQMTVLPFIMFSLIGNIGRLSFGESRKFAATALSVLLLLWGVGILTLLFIPLALPRWDTGSFFSTSLLEAKSEFDFLTLFIPSNPFHSLANNFAPAVVLFCILFGVAVIGVKGKEQLLGHFATITATLSRVNHYIVRLSPIGIFSISASATGTLTLEEFGRLQAYFITFIGGVLLLTVWVLPMLVASCTPIKYKDLLVASRSALLTAFVVGSVFVVIPLLADSVRDLLKKYQPQGGPTNPELVVSVAYPFPNLGKILTLLFVPFASWFYGSAMVLSDYPFFVASGLLMSFGKVTTTIPFLLALQEIPSDIFQLFLMSSVLAGRFSDLLAGMHLLAFTALTTFAMAGLLTLNRLKLVVTLVVGVLVGAGFVATTHSTLQITFQKVFTKDKILAGMHLMQPQVPMQVMHSREPHPAQLLRGQSRLERIRETGVIRIGFHPDNLPYSYYNARRELVGLDIDMAHRLARDLGVSIEFVPFAFATLAEQLAEDHFDIAMSGIAVTVERAATMLLSEPYMDVTVALVVRDHEQKQLGDLDSLRRGRSLSIGGQIDSYFAKSIREHLPDVQVVELWAESQFFEGPPQYMDALVTSAEGGAAWTLLYPGFSVVNPMRNSVSVPLAYPLAGRDQQLEDFLEWWIHLKQQDGTIRNLYDYWILGRGAESDGPRWSVIRDVLGWVD